MNKIKMYFLALLAVASTGANAGLNNVYEIHIENAIGRHLQISEVVAIETSSGNDLALFSAGANAIGSSNWGPTTSPYYAIDGIAPAGWPGGIFHGASGDLNTSLKVFLDSPSELDSLTLFGRTDCCSDRDVYNVFLYDSLGGLLFSGADLNAFNIDHSVTIDFSGMAAPVPEPSTLALMALGLAGVGFAARRRKA